jgi:hypothetical protein
LVFHFSLIYATFVNVKMAGSYWHTLIFHLFFLVINTSSLDNTCPSPHIYYVKLFHCTFLLPCDALDTVKTKTEEDNKP